MKGKQQSIFHFLANILASARQSSATLAFPSEMPASQTITRSDSVCSRETWEIEEDAK